MDCWRRRRRGLSGGRVRGPPSLRTGFQGSRWRRRGWPLARQHQRREAGAAWGSGSRALLMWDPSETMCPSWKRESPCWPPLSLLSIFQESEKWRGGGGGQEERQQDGKPWLTKGAPESGFFHTKLTTVFLPHGAADDPREAQAEQRSFSLFLDFSYFRPLEQGGKAGPGNGMGTG